MKSNPFVLRPVLWFAAGVVVTGIALRVIPGARPGETAPGQPRPAAGAPATPAAAARPFNNLITLTDARQAAQIELATATSAPLPLTGQMAARLASDENATTHLTVPVDGRVLRVLHQLGDAVRAGEPLIEVDAPDLGQALADATKARADVALKRATLARAEELFANQVLARKDLETARAERAQADAELARTELRLRNLNALGKVRGQTFIVSSPLGGVVTERNVTVGQQVQASSGTVLVSVSDPRRLMLIIDAPEADAAKVKPGMPIQFQVDAQPDRQFQATLFRIAPQVDATTRRVQLRATVDNADGSLRPEMFARALPTSDTGQSATMIPTSALLQLGAHTVVFIARDNHQYEQRQVDIVVQHGTQAWLRSGLNPGDQVVTSGTLLLKSELVGQ